MKITKSQLKQIIKEELEEVAGIPVAPLGGGTAEEKMNKHLRAAKNLKQMSAEELAKLLKDHPGTEEFVKELMTSPMYGEVKEEKGKYDDGDGKDEKCDYVPCKDDLKEDVGQKVDRNTYKQQLRGKMDPLSKEELEKILPGELIADPMNPATFSRPGTLIPLGKKDGKVYFKTEYGPVMMKQIEVV